MNEFIKKHLIPSGEVHLMPDLFVEKQQRDLDADNNRFANRCYKTIVFTAAQKLASRLFAIQFSI